MASSKSHSSKRSSSTSYASTISTVIFVILCVLGVWMLTSNSMVPPQTTTRAATTISSTGFSSRRNNNNWETDTRKPQSTSNPSFVNDNDQTQGKKPESKSDQAVYEDNPGQLPDDAIKSDEPQKSQRWDRNLDNKEKHGGSGGEENYKGIQGTEHSEEKERLKQGENQISEESALLQSEQMKQSSIEKGNHSAESKQQNESEQGGSNTTEDKRLDKGTEETQEDAQNQKPNENQMQEPRNQMMEYEKEQRQQRQEDAGDFKTSQDSQNDSDQQTNKNKGQDQEQEEQKTEQEQVSSTGVTFNDSTREHQPTEQALFKEVTQTQNSTNSESGLKEQKEAGKAESEEQGSDETNQESKQKTYTVESSSDESNSDELSSNSSLSKGNPEIPKESNLDESTSGEGTASGSSTGRKNPGPSKESGEPKSDGSNSKGSFAGGENSGIPKESAESRKGWKTQATESKNEKQRQKHENDDKERIKSYEWGLCNTSNGPDYIPCLDNEEAIMRLKSRKHFEHRERHCPEDPPMCLVPLPEGYKEPIKWPDSRDKIWYHNVPHTKLAEVKGHQNWVKVTGEFLTFPGGGTQFIHGALHYIDFLQQSVPQIGWGKHTRVVLDVGCGVASFGGYLFDRDVLTMSFAPKDEHEAQVQFALERGIPAISAVMGSQRLPYPGRVFDLVHCARCRVPWHNDGGLLLLELNRMLRPGGYFVWSATPVYQKLQVDVEIWKAMSSLTASMCWELVAIKKDKLNGIGAAIYQKPISNDCYEKRKQNQPPMCKNDDDPNAAWHVPLQPCMHKVPVTPAERGSKWPEDWPRRLQTPPYWLNGSQMGIYGKPSPQDFTTDYEHWKHVVTKVYMKELGIKWSNVRNVMDMRAVYGGFAAALRDLQVWVMNAVNINSPDTLPIIYERGLFGIYHDWCESFSTYPRSYDLLHADHLFSKLQERCKIAPVMVEVDRIVRPGGKLIVRDDSGVIREVAKLLNSLHWKVHLNFSKNQEGLLSAQKGNWRPDKTEVSS